MKPQTTLKLLTAIASLALPMLAGAAQINLVGNDGLGTSSFNSGQNWANGLAPVSTNDYFTAGYFMRTPGNSTTAYTFGGASLSLGPCNLSGGVNGSLLEKFSSGAGSVRTLTINNLTNLTGAMLRSGGTAGALVHITGNHFTIAGNSIMQADQCIWVVDSPLLGGDNVILTNFANNANDHVAYTANNSGFTGSWYLTGAGTSAWSLELDGLSSLPGNPSTFNPGQITFLGTGQLRDTVGCSFTNSNGGLTLTANATINTSASTLIGEPITDLTNGVSSVSSLTSSGAGTLVLSNANNSYLGGTIISAGILQQGIANAIPAPATANQGDLTDNGMFDLNGYNATINGLNGSGAVDTTAPSGTPTLTIGANGDSGTLSGVIQNSSGILSLNKVGAGTETLSGGYGYSGTTSVGGGTLSLTTSGSLPSTPGNMIVSNWATLAINSSSGNAAPVNNLTVAANGSLTLTLNPAATGLTVAGSLTLQDNATNNFGFGTITANPTAAVINVAGGISAPGSNIVINIAATGLQPGTFTLIKYSGATLANLANFQISPPPGVSAVLVNNTGNHSIDLHVTAIPNQLVWNGVNGTSWDLSTANWTNPVTGTITLFQQYTNNGVVAGDAVTFDDTLTNSSPQPTNVVLNSMFYAYPVIFNNTLPYTIAGSGGIQGVTSVLVTNSGSVTLLTSNAFTGGVSINNGSLVITNDSALGASSGTITLNNGTLQMNGGVTNSRAINMPTAATLAVSVNNTARLTGAVTAASTFFKADNGTLVLAHKESISGDVFLHLGTTVIDTGGAITNTVYDDVGQDTNDAATLTIQGTGSFNTSSDFNVGDLGASVGTLNVTGSGTLTMNAFYIGSANASGSTAVGTVNQSGGTITELSTAVGTFCIGGRTSTSAVGTYNMSGGTLTANAGIRVGSTGIGTLNQSGGTINALGGINIARIAGSFGTNNLNGGVLSTYNIASSTGTNAVFNFNGGTLQANFSPLTTTWFAGGIVANILAGGAIVDSSNYNVTISVPLLADSAHGGLTKQGAGTLTLSATNTFTGPITNNAGTLYLNSSSTYAGAAVVNAGTLQVTTASTLQGGAAVGNNAVLSVLQSGSATETIGNLTLNGAASTPGATVALAPTVANNPMVAMLNCSTLTLMGTNTISLPVESIGTIALIKYATLAGTGNCTNLSLPQGASGYVSNNAANSTIYAVVTSTGPGIFWTGTNTVASKTNVWDVSASTNWVLNTTPTTYHQVVIPGDLVTFSDLGSGTVLLSNNVGPASLVISNNAKTYTFSGNGTISGPTGLQKLGTGTAIMNLTNNSYLGNTVISNGTLQVGGVTALSPTTVVVIGPAGTLELAGINQSVAELTGVGIVDNNSGVDELLTLGTSAGGTWNGSIQNHGHGGVALIKNGAGTWIVGGNNALNNGSPFTTTNIFNAGTTIITNGGSLDISRLQAFIGFGSGSANVIVAGGTLAVSNEVLGVGFSGASGTLTVNSGTVFHGGGPYGSFGAANQLIIGDAGTGTLTVNGGQVLSGQGEALWLGDGSGASGTLQLNGGLVQVADITASTSPSTSVAYFNGGILQANTNSTDFIDSSTTTYIQSGGLILDDGGWSIILPTGFQPDPNSAGGGLVKQGAGTVYLDGSSSYTGTTLVNNGMLAGAGNVAGPVVVAPTGNLGAGDAGGIGTFEVANNLTLQGNTTLRINVNSAYPTEDQVIVNGNVTYGGILTITNTTSDNTALNTSYSFPLFTGYTGHANNFSGIVGSPGTGLAYSFNPATGTLSIITQTYVNYPTNLTFNVSGNSLSIGWPQDHEGWILQAQTNSLGAGLSSSSGNWFDIPTSSSVTNETIIVNPSNPTVFYRLRHP